ncbi:MAG: zinc-binding dehydrogenase [Kiritimatiellae bacterium]|nr:zinc-binding dehydrogenase [Kiritimatiellia bacterium]
MKALVYYRSVPRFLLGKTLNRIMPNHFFSTVTPLQLREMIFKCPSGWITLKPGLCGICGSDLNLLRGSESLLLEPYASFPFILGHEIVGEIFDSPSGSEWHNGDRVVIEPLLPCDIRGVERCSFCATGNYNLCENFTAGSLPPVILTGYTKEAGGGAAQLMACHPKQLIRLPKVISDEKAVLTDSLASALQPVLNNFPGDKSTVVIYGAGITGQHVIRILRYFDSKATLVVVARYDFQKELALAGGADKVLTCPNRQALGSAINARFLPSTFDGGNLEGGAHFFFDCAGTTKSIQEGLLALRGKGQYVMIGTAAKVGPLDISSLWFRELQITGSSCYGNTKLNGQSIHTYSKAVEILSHEHYNTAGLLSHTFSLDKYKDAFSAAFNKDRYRSVKIALDMRTP